MKGFLMNIEVPVRSLGCMEEYVWLLEQRSTRMALLCAEVDGSTKLSQWQHALRLLQKKYANISMRVAHEHNIRPFFFRSSGEDIPLLSLPLTHETDVLEECRRAMENSFGDGSGPPLRVRLLLGVNSAAVILSAHHAFFDGIGLMNLIRDTLSFVAAEEEPVAQPQTPSLDSLVGLEVPHGYAPRNEMGADESSEKNLPLVALRPPKVSRIQLSQEMTKAIVERARQQGTTANGILMATFLEAGRAAGDHWRKNDLTCVVPVNVRSLFHQEQAEGIVFGQKRFVFDLLQPTDFWETAHACSEGVKEIRTVDGLKANLSPLRDFLSVKRSVAEAVKLTDAYPHDLMVSNFGNFDGPTSFGSLRLTAITPVVDSGAANTQTVMVATTDERMTIVLVSPNPLPNLLSKIELRLEEVCLPHSVSVQDR